MPDKKRINHVTYAKKSEKRFRNFNLGLGSNAKHNVIGLLTVLSKYPMAEEIHKALCGRRINKMTPHELMALRDILLTFTSNVEDEIAHKTSHRINGFTHGATKQMLLLFEVDSLKEKMKEQFKNYPCVKDLFESARVFVPKSLPRHKVDEAPIHIETKETDIEMLNDIAQIFIDKGYKVQILPFSYASVDDCITIKIRKKTPEELELSLRKNLGTI
ncbi:MAG: hypothetical protein KAS32_30325 [Candidatus Peribacteraceae bacterium]|nr:hypothetical protein [Candidatus Peribacteraceae bacterium]